MLFWGPKEGAYFGELPLSRSQGLWGVTLGAGSEDMPRFRKFPNLSQAGWPRLPPFSMQTVPNPQGAHQVSSSRSCKHPGSGPDDVKELSDDEAQEIFMQQMLSDLIPHAP